MTDGTRSGAFPLDAAEAFALNVSRWLDQYGSLIEALVAVRELGDEPAARDALLEVVQVRVLAESWDLWRLFADAPTEELDARLARFLGTERVRHLRFALWGTTADSTKPELGFW